MLLHVVADYGQGDLAFAEVAQRLLSHLPQAQLVYTAVPPFATLAAGFCVAQLALNSPPAGTAVFQNVAPRRDDRSARRDNDGERLVCARLESGVVVVGPNAGYAFSFIAAAASELRYVQVSSGGSQFRSRDIFPQAFARILAGEEELLGEEVPAAAVPQPPEGAIAFVDGYGNLKTTFSGDDHVPGTRLAVRIGEVEREAVVAGGGFEVADGELAFAPGSSGWALPGGGRRRFRELFLRGGNAWEAFGKPPIESRIGLSVSVA